MSQTMVVNCKFESPEVYIGRTMAHTPWVNQGWGNPFRGPGAIERYEAWIRTQPRLLARLPELDGKRLGCWCASTLGLTTYTGPLVCHGQVLLKLLAELDADGGVGARLPAPRPGPRGPRQAAASVEGQR